MSLEEDHDTILAQIEQAIAEHHPDLLIIAGDIFDRTSPPQSALVRFGNFIRRVTDGSDLSVAMIAGNHDSAAQIGMMGVLPSGGRSLVRGPIDRDELPLVLQDEHGDVAISALPFSYEYAARSCFEDDGIACPADVLRAQIESARRRVPDGARWIMIAHAFVQGASTSESERSLSRTVGGIETVPASIFDGAHYVALGHLHRPQTAGAPHIRFSGAPLAFGLDEEGDQKSLTLVDLNADGSVDIALVPLKPRRGIRTIRGKLAELIALEAVCDDFTGVVLTDEAPQIDPMRRIREKYPNAVHLRYERQRQDIARAIAAGQSALNDPKKLVSDFVAFVRDADLTAPEGAVLDGALAEIREEAEAK